LHRQAVSRQDDPSSADAVVHRRRSDDGRSPSGRRAAAGFGDGRATRRPAGAAARRHHHVLRRLQGNRRRLDAAPRLAIGRRQAERRVDGRVGQAEPGLQVGRVLGQMSPATLLVAILLSQAPAPDASLRVTVVDPSGAVIVGARVTVQAETPDAGRVALDTGPRGEATFQALTPGRYQFRVESPGFEAYDARDVRIRRGENRREVRLKIARLAETIDVTRDARERASDPRNDAFATVLGQAEINELPDDPDEMERVLKEMAGPGAT